VSAAVAIAVAAEAIATAMRIVIAKKADS
jgi:hypothetical protein